MTLRKTQRAVLKGVFFTLALLLAGFAKQADTSLYNWDNYQKTVYQYYQGDKVGPEEQIASLKESIEKSRETGKAVPPGLHAQLGLIPVIPIWHFRNSILRKVYILSQQPTWISC